MFLDSVVFIKNEFYKQVNSMTQDKCCVLTADMAGAKVRFTEFDHAIEGGIFLRIEQQFFMQFNINQVDGMQ